jgi:hypothetical protein
MPAGGVEEGDASDTGILVAAGGVEEGCAGVVVKVGEALDGGASDVVVAIFVGEVEQESEGFG